MEQITNQNEWPLSGLQPNPMNPRETPRDEGYAELVASIRVQGILQPLLITSAGMILAGHRRYEAAKDLKLQTVPVRVFDAIEPEDYELICLIENLLRSDLKPLAVGRYLQEFRERHDMTTQEIAGVTGISVSTICKYLRLMNAPDEVREMLATDQIGVGTAMELSRHDPTLIAEIVKQPNLTKTLVQEFASTRQVREPTYKEMRQRDVSIALDLLRQVSSRLGPYEGDPKLSFTDQINHIETLLGDASIAVRKLEDGLVDAQMSLVKKERRSSAASAEAS